MTDKELYDYFWQIVSDPNTIKDKKEVAWNARQFWHQLQDSVYEKYGDRLVKPTHICDTSNPFTIHFTWDYRDGNILGCSVNEKSEIYICFNNDSYHWSESSISERLMAVIYDYYLEEVL